LIVDVGKTGEMMKKGKEGKEGRKEGGGFQ
jgi:hypothetical protein